MPKKRKGETITPEPCDGSSQNTMLLKQPQPPLVETHPPDTMLLKQPPCDGDMELDELDNEMPSAFYREEGKPIDLKALLSSKDRDYLVSPMSGERVPISSLDQNYVLLCAFTLPHLDSFAPAVRHSLQALYSELTRLKIDHTVKLVVVLKLKPPLDKDESAFRNFFSLLPLNCLAVPSSATNHIYHSRLGLNHDNGNDFCNLAVNPDGILLMGNSFFLRKYGAESFPFTYDHFTTIIGHDKIIKHMIRSPSPKYRNMATLQEILKCSYLRQIANESISVPVSDLANATFGLYLYVDGRSMDLIRDVHRKCKFEKRSFEIILLPLPFDTPDDPAVFCDTVKKSALENPTSSTWWTYDFNDKLCRALWRVIHCHDEDHLIILPSGGHPGDVFGKQIAYRYGMDAYPFTREVIVEMKLKEVRSMTLESLLGKSRMTELDLYNKNVVIYHGDPKCCYRSRDYIDILDNYPGTKVIFSHLGYDDIGNFQDIGWSVPTNICNTIFYDVYNGFVGKTMLITFGKDGKILSRCAEHNLPRMSPSSSASLFDDHLRDEIYFDLTVKMRAESCEGESTN